MSLTLGEKLRQAREERGLSIAEVAEQTRISPLYLQSIENDDYKPLPGGIFNKGFVKSYAKFVGVDEQEALNDYQRILSQTESGNQSDLKVYRPEVLTDDHSSGSMLPTIIFAGIILALMTGGILFVVNYLQNQPSAPAANANTAKESKPVAEPTQQQPAQPSFDEIRLDFTATAEKISVTATLDGNQKVEEVAAGSTSQYVAANSLKLSYYRGFADKVEIKLNGKAMKVPGPPARGNAIIIDLNKDNVAAIWQAGDLSFVPGTQPAATAEPAASPSPAQTPAANAAATPAATVTPVRTPTPERTATPARPATPTPAARQTPAPSPRTTP